MPPIAKRISGFFNPAYEPIDGVILSGIVWTFPSQYDVLVDTIYAGYFNNNLAAAGLNATNVMGRIILGYGEISIEPNLLLTFNRVRGDAVASSQFPGFTPLVDLPINDFGVRKYHFDEPVHWEKNQNPIIAVFAGYRQGDVYGTPTQTIATLTVSGQTVPDYTRSYERSALPKGKWR
jgi:hypothetical protein